MNTENGRTDSIDSQKPPAESFTILFILESVICVGC